MIPIKSFSLLRLCHPSAFVRPRRSLFDLLAIFNAVDTDRIKEVGPERACAEWLIKNGAGVRWCGDKEIYKDYNSLAFVGSYCIEEIDASDAAISHHGFPYLKGCNHIKTIILHNCASLQDRALPFLELVKPSLTRLQLSRCYNISDRGLTSIEKLTNLKTLQMFGLPEVRNQSVALTNLKRALPNCNISHDFKL